MKTSAAAGSRLFGIFDAFFCDDAFLMPFLMAVRSFSKPSSLVLTHHHHGGLLGGFSRALEQSNLRRACRIQDLPSRVDLVSKAPAVRFFCTLSQAIGMPSLDQLDPSIEESSLPISKFHCGNHALYSDIAFNRMTSAATP